MWTGPSIDPDGMGSVVTASLPVYDHKERFLAVASVDLGLDTLAGLLDTPEGAEDAWLVDDKGRIVVWEDMDARGAKKVEPRPLPYPELWPAMKTADEGWVDEGGHIAFFKRIPSLGWTYVVVADDGVVW